MFLSPTTLAFLGGEVGPEMLEEMRETNRVLMEVRDLLKQQVSEEGISFLPLCCTREIAGSSALPAEFWSSGALQVKGALELLLWKPGSRGGLAIRSVILAQSGFL